MLIINKHQKTILSQQGFTLVEFMISMALSLAAILVVTSIYITSFQIDSKTIKFSRLNDEVTSIMALLSEDIKRAGYVENAENLPLSPEEFRTILVTDATAGANDNSCILFSYDFDNAGVGDGVGSYESPSEAFGYRFKNNELQTRQSASGCTGTNWEALTDPSFVKIEATEIKDADGNVIDTIDFFKCKVSDDGDTDDYETDTVTVAGVTTTTNIEIDCAAGNLPYQSHPADEKGEKGHITVEISFTATLVDDDNISITASEKILVRNKSYD